MAMVMVAMIMKKKKEEEEEDKDKERYKGGGILEGGHCRKDAVCVHSCWLCLFCLAQPSWSEELGSGKTAAFSRFPPCGEDEVFFSQGPPTM